MWFWKLSSTFSIPSFAVGLAIVSAGEPISIEVTLAEYDGEAHGVVLYPDQIDYVQRIIAWFDAHLKR